MEKWKVYMKKADFSALGEEFHIDPVIARIIRNRDLINEEDIRKYLYGTKEDLYSPFLLKDCKTAIDLIHDTICQRGKIRIISDYDVDGVMSNYILFSCLKKAGAHVDYVIPDRIEDGYGIHMRMVEAAYMDDVALLITCDNGIAAEAEIQKAKDLGICVIVTDHHDVPYIQGEEGEKEEKLPPADAVVNPKQQACSYPCCYLCGAAVAWKLMCAYFETYYLPMEYAENMLPYAAIATICDVVDLLDENRLIVQLGLAMLRKTEHMGLKALMEQNELVQSELTAYHFGFIIGPCMNATGRIATANLSMELLLAKTEKDAKKYAMKLYELNQQRKDMTEQYLQKGIDYIETRGYWKDKVLVVYLPECHESIAGIIAGRIKEKYYRPTLVVTKAKEGLKGSARSIEGYHMYEGLNRCKGLLTRFGGHPMAAGFSLPEQNLELLRKKLNEESGLTEEDCKRVVHIDVPMPISYITEQLVQQLNLLEPFGKANPKPLFAEKHVRILSYRILGKNKNVCKMVVENQYGKRMDALLFHEIEAFTHLLKTHLRTKTLDSVSFRSLKVFLDIVYYPDVNTYRGETSVQIVITNYQLG
ncbi:MAG: single-stranded-DNA-specific exonuclease RecJ [Lachnospiraceae bacterium]